MLKLTKILIDSEPIKSEFTAICDTCSPVFSWAVKSDAKNDRQSACHVRVLCGERLLWDSGTVESDKQYLRCGTDKLPSGVLLTLEVSVRDIFGEESEPLRESFVCGVVDKWDAMWIGASEKPSRAAIYFKKAFDVKSEPVSACLYMCGIGYHEASLNGIPVSNARLDPAHSNYSKTCYYAVLPNVAEFITQGENSLDITVADGWRHNDSPIPMRTVNEGKCTFFGIPELTAILELRYSDGTCERIVTDESWSYAYGPITMANIYDGETFDAQLNADKLCYKPAEIVKAPGGILRPMALEPILEREVYEAADMFELENGSYVVDFGQNIAGVAKLTLPEKLNAGQEIKLTFMELLDEDGDLYLPNLRDAKQTDTYIASGDARDLKIWQPHFTYHGFRYARVSGIPCFDRRSIKAVALYTDIKNDSSFECGSALVTKIHKNVVATEKSNIHSILTDCPQRDERMGWLNDATVRFEETPYNFDIGAIFPKVIRDIRDEQLPTGEFSCCCPRVFGMMPADPVCSSYLVAGLESYLHAGNLDIIREAFDGFAAWENCLLNHSDGYIVNYSYYGDWASPAYACDNPEGANSAVTPGILMSTGYSYFNCKTLAYFAELLGNTDEAHKYSELAEKIRAAFLEKWWNDESAVVATGSQACQAFSLWLGILPEDKRQAAADVIHADLVKNDYKITTGNLCTRYLMDVLCDWGYLGDAWKLIASEKYPSFGYMIENEATTVWERFELKKNGGMNSHNHPMYGAVGYWFYAYLCGVKVTGRGFSRFSVKPYYPEGLLSAHCVIDTVLGDVSVRWIRRYGEVHLYVSVPFGAEADVETNEGVISVGSGSHHFHWKDNN